MKINKKKIKIYSVDIQLDKNSNSQDIYYYIKI